MNSDEIQAKLDEVEKLIKDLLHLLDVEGASGDEIGAMSLGAAAQHHLDEAARLSLLGAALWLGRRSEDGMASLKERSVAVDIIRGIVKMLPWLTHEHEKMP